MVAMMLSVLQTMKWYLKSAFRKSPTFFGGMEDNLLMGFGESNGALPPGFLAICTLLINSYWKQGHGVQFLSSLARVAFTLAAVEYVGNSNLLHLTQGTPTDSEFLASV